MPYSRTARRSSGLKKNRWRASTGTTPHHRSRRCRCASSWVRAMSSASASMPAAGSSSTGRHGPTSCGEVVAPDTRSAGARRRPCASAASARAALSAGSAGCASRSSRRLARHASRLRHSITATPASQAASSPCVHALPLPASGAAASGCAARARPVPAGAPVAAAAGSHGSGSGAANRPASACTPTSHHSQHWVEAGMCGRARVNAQTSATSNAVCRLVAPSRSSTSSNQVSIVSLPCGRIAVFRPRPAAAPVRHR